MKKLLIDMRTATITAKGQVAIPKSARGKTFKTGTKVAILAFEDRIELRPMKQVNERIATALASEKALRKDWDKEDKIWKHL